MRQIELVNVGPIEKLSIPVPEDGGVVVLQGFNGSGKSTAIDAAASLMDPDADAGLTVRDGEERGSIVGLGVEISLKKRTARAGTLSVQRISGEDPALLVDPGLKDPVAADKARLKALCRLARVKPSRATFEPLEAMVGGTLPITLADDLPESAAKTKRAIEMKARDVEEVVTRDEGRVQGLLLGVAGVDLEGPHDEQALAQAATKAIKELASVEGEATACLRASQEAEQARVALEAAKASYTGPRLLEAQQAASAALLKEADAKAALRDAQEAKRAADAALKAAADHQNAMAGWEATIAKAENAFGVSEDQLGKLREAVAIAQDAQSTGAIVRQALAQRKEAEQANAALTEKRAFAAKLREAAAACDRIVSESIASVAPRGLKVANGRLIVSHRRGEIPFEELSHGERWAIALDVAIDAVGKDGLLSIAQEAWEGLDLEHRQAINEHAKSRGAVILTAEATMDDLRAEVVK